MTSPPRLLPSSLLVAIGWLRLALPGVEVGEDLPDFSTESTASQDALRAVGFVRVSVVGGTPHLEVPRRNPVVSAESWLAPQALTGKASWARAHNLAGRIVTATWDPSLMGKVVDLSAVGNYASARVDTVNALGEPDEVEEDESDWARVDVELDLSWVAA